MIQNYCRTCGAKVLVKSVCYNCGCQPWKGNEYCNNCGSQTKPNAIICISCGITFKNNSRTIITGLIALIVLIIAAWGVYLIYEKRDTKKELIITPPAVNADTNHKISVPTKTAEIKPAVTNRPALPVPLQQMGTTVPEIKAAVPGKKVSPNIFSFKELDEYTIDCSFYCQKGRPSSVIFFKTRSLGYIKLNGQIYQLKLKLQNEDQGILKFSSETLEALIEIEGLTGNENAWISSGTLTLSGLEDGIVSRYKIYSSCIVFK